DAGPRQTASPSESAFLLLTGLLGLRGIAVGGGSRRRRGRGRGRGGGLGGRWGGVSRRGGGWGPGPGGGRGAGTGGGAGGGGRSGRRIRQQFDFLDDHRLQRRIRFERPHGAGGRDADPVDHVHAFDDVAKHGVTPARGQGIEGVVVVPDIHIKLGVTRVG